MAGFAAGQRRYVLGRPEPYLDMWSKKDPVSLLEPGDLAIPAMSTSKCRPPE